MQDGFSKIKNVVSTLTKTITDQKTEIDSLKIMCEELAIFKKKIKEETRDRHMMGESIKKDAVIGRTEV